MARLTSPRRDIAQEARAAVAAVFEAMGGVEGLFEWARRNPDKFYLFLFPRLLPKEVKATVDTNASGAVFRAVEVMNPQEALNLLERLRYEGDKPSHDTVEQEASTAIVQVK